MPWWTLGCRELFETLISLLSGMYPGVGLLDRRIVLVSVFKEDSTPIFTLAVQFTFLPAVSEGSLFSASSPALVLCRLFDNSHACPPFLEDWREGGPGEETVFCPEGQWLPVLGGWKVSRAGGGEALRPAWLHVQAQGRSDQSTSCPIASVSPSDKGAGSSAYLEGYCEVG